MPKWLRDSWLAMLVLGVLAVTTAALVAFVTGSATDSALDRLRLPIALAVVKRFGVKANLAIVRACVAIANNESGGAAAPVIGDTGLGGGPSIGPMQVYRSTAVVETLPTVHWSVTGRLKRHFCLYTAICADSGKHLTL